jgi:hypothetical protein
VATAGRERQFWFGIGKRSAAAYLYRRDWLYRRVESIEFLSPRSARRCVSVDFEFPMGLLPELGRRAARFGRLVPLSTVPKWPPLTDFDFEGPDGRALSLYVGDTNKALDYGLVIGIAGTVCKLTPRLDAKLAEVVSSGEPSNRLVTETTRLLAAELAAGVRRDMPEEVRRLRSGYAKEAVDLAGQLGNRSILWAPVAAERGEDMLVKFSYLDSLGGLTHDRRAMWKQLLIGCSWWQRTIVLSLPHAGLHTRYHLDVLPPAPGVELTRIQLFGWPGPAEIDELLTVDEDHQVGSSTADGGGSTSGTAATDARDPKGNPDTTGPREAAGAAAGANAEPEAETNPGVPEYSAVVDGRAILYRGYGEARSHRQFVHLRLAASRHGFITGCTVSATVITVMMTAVFAWLAFADQNLDSTIVLLAAVPVVLGYVLVRPGVTDVERLHLVGVRTMALAAGALPIVGAFSLLFAHKTGDSVSSVVRNVWGLLVIASWTVMGGLIMSWFYAARQDAGASIAARGAAEDQKARPLAPTNGIVLGVALVAGYILSSRAATVWHRPAAARYLVSHRGQVVVGELCLAAGAVMLYGILARLWQVLAPRRTEAEATDRRNFRRLVIYPGLTWIWLTILGAVTTAWLALTAIVLRTGSGQVAVTNRLSLSWLATVEHFDWLIVLLPGVVFGVATTRRLVKHRERVLVQDATSGLVAAGTAAACVVGLCCARIVLWAIPGVGSLPPMWPGIAIAVFMMILAVGLPVRPQEVPVPHQ